MGRKAVRGPAGQVRPADAVENAMVMARISTGEAEEQFDQRDPERQARGAKGGAARASRLTAQQRSEAARKAVDARWKKAG